MISERIKFKEEYEGRDFQLVGDRSRMMIALRNIFINAIEAIQGKGEIKIIVAEEKDKSKIQALESEKRCWIESLNPISQLKTWEPD